MECQLRGTPEVLLNEHVGTWHHQMSVQAWWDHPSLGELFWIHNQWTLTVHGICPSGAPGGGFWILKKDMEWICRNGEVYIFSLLDGYDAQEVPWDWESNWTV